MFRNIILFFFAVLFVSCGEDVVMVEDPSPPVETDEVFEVNLIGFSTNEEREYLSNATIKIDNQLETSDETGLFFLEKVLIGQKGKIAQVNKAGYLPSFHRVANHASLEEIVLNLEMAKAPESMTIGSSGGMVEGKNGMLTIGSEDIESNTDVIFQTFIGEEVNHGNDDQLYFGDQTEFLLKAASLYFYSSTSFAANAQLRVQIEIDQFNFSEIADLSFFHFDESTLSWKQKSIELTKLGSQISFDIDAFGWWTIAEKVPAQYGKIKMLQVNDTPIHKAEVDMSFDNERYSGSKFYTSHSGEISTYFPSNRSIKISMNDGEYESELSSGITPVPDVNEILISEEVQIPIEGKVYACDFSLSDGYVAIFGERQHKIIEVRDGLFNTEVFASATDIKFQFYEDNLDATNLKTSDVESILSENSSFISCLDLDDNLMVSDGINLIQDFDRCRIKVRPKETVVIGERNNGDVFLVSFEGKTEGVYDGLFYFEDILEDVKSEVEVNVILFDNEANKVGGFIKTEYISTGEELNISFIGNIE